MDQQAGRYTPHSLSDLTAGSTAFLENGGPPEQTFLVVLDPESAVSHPDQLLGILCFQNWPRQLQTITAPRGNSNSKKMEGPQDAEMIELTAEEHQVLTERAIMEPGPAATLGGQNLIPERVLFLKPGAYPPRWLTHNQACDWPECRISSSLDSMESHPASIPPSRESPSLSQPQAQATAAAAVLKCTELLELILLHLDLKTRITSAPRVSHFWLDTLNHSPTLQKASFFKADRQSLEPGEQPYINPLLQEAFGYYFFSLLSTSSNSPPEASTDKRLFRRAEYFWKLPWAPENLHLMKAKTGSVLDVEPSCHQLSFTRKGASWRRMLVSQPPPAFLGFTWLDCFPDVEDAGQGHGFYVDSVEPPTTTANTYNFDAGGVTMGLLYDTVQLLTMQQNQPGLFFRIRWDMTCERPITTMSDSKSVGDENENTPPRESTNLVVEFWDDAYFNSTNYGPFSMEATRRAFTCEEAVKPTFRGGQAWIQGLTGDEVHAVPGNDEFELWEPLQWDGE